MIKVFRFCIIIIMLFLKIHFRQDGSLEIDSHMARVII